MAGTLLYVILFMEEGANEHDDYVMVSDHFGL